jgi:ATP synthase F1 delta subunit
MNVFARAIGAQIARFLNRPSTTYAPPTTNSLAALRAVIRPGDVLLVEGDRHISTAIKYLTQSTWSHAALCVAPSQAADPDAPVLIEADMDHGVGLVPLTKYGAMHTRICRPVGLTPLQIDAVVAALGGWATEPTKRTAHLLVSLRKAALFPELAHRFSHFVSEYRKSLSLEVTVATAANDNDVQDLRARLSKALGGEVTLAVKSDAALLGGLTVRLGDRLLDRSVAGTLRRMAIDLTR